MQMLVCEGDYVYIKSHLFIYLQMLIRPVSSCQSNATSLAFLDVDEEDDDDDDVVHTPAPSRPTSSTSSRTLAVVIGVITIVVIVIIIVIASMLVQDSL